MFKIERTPLETVLASPSVNQGLYFPEEDHDPIMLKYGFPAIKLGINPILKYLPSGRYCIAGGTFRSLFFNEIPTDIDIYPLEPHFTNNVYIHDEIHDRMMEGTSVQVFEKFNSLHVNIKETGTSVDILTGKFSYLPYSFQIITKSKGTEFVEIRPTCADDIISTFDIIPACFGIDFTLTTEPNQAYPSYTINEVAIHPDYFYSLGNKYLMVNEQPSKFESKRMKAERFYKYIANYGFKVPSTEEMQKFNVLLAKEPHGTDIEYE